MTSLETSSSTARLRQGAMERFGDVLSEAVFDAIHAYLVDQSWQAYKAQEGVVTFGPCRARPLALILTMTKISYAGYRFPPDIIQQAIWLYVRFTMSFRDVEDLLAERGIMVSYEIVRRSLSENRWPHGLSVARRRRRG